VVNNDLVENNPDFAQIPEKTPECLQAGVSEEEEENGRKNRGNKEHRRLV
jgi:hypothetical protein